MLVGLLAACLKALEPLLQRENLAGYLTQLVALLLAVAKLLLPLWEKEKITAS
ncbi:MAG: hypothetical protein WBO19_10770 [Terriglobia bacterium]|jgi:uncharacterized membrane protein